MLTRILFLVPLWLLLDLYFFQVLKKAVSGLPPWGRKSIYAFYWGFDLLLILALFQLKLSGSGIFSGYFFFLVGPILLSLLPKLAVLPFLLMEDLGRLAVFAR